MSFSADLEKFARKLDRTLEQTYRGVCIKLFSAVIMDTPVLDGDLRGSWYTKENVPEINYTPRNDRTGSVTISEMTRLVNKSKLGGVMTMANSLPYAHTIEYDGHSSVKAPAGMMRINVARISTIIHEAVQESKR